MMSTSASSASAVTSMPCATTSPSIISASTRFLAHPRLIIPTFTTEGGRRTSAADSGRLHSSVKLIQSVDHYITGVTGDKLPVLSNLNRPFIPGVNPESLPLDDNGSAVRRRKSLIHGLSSLFVLRHFNVSPPDHPNLQLFFRQCRQTCPARVVNRCRGWGSPRRQCPSDFNSAFDTRLRRIHRAYLRR